VTGQEPAAQQATVHAFDPATRSGSVLLDDGVELPFGSEAFDGSGLRLLRLGQRLAIRTDGERVLAMTLVTFAL
jgi:2-phospho-L-lactate guanylyltransferase